MGIPKGSKARPELEGEGDEGLGARGEGRGCWVEALG